MSRTPHSQTTGGEYEDKEARRRLSETKEAKLRFSSYSSLPGGPSSLSALQQGLDLVGVFLKEIYCAWKPVAMHIKVNQS